MAETREFILFVLCFGGIIALFLGAFWVYLDFASAGTIHDRAGLMSKRKWKEENDEELFDWIDTRNDPLHQDYFLLNPAASDHLCNIYHSDWLTRQEEDGC